MRNDDLLVEAFTDERLLNLIKAPLDVEYMISKVEKRIDLSLKIIREPIHNNLLLLVNERLDAIEDSLRDVIWSTGINSLQVFESCFQNNESGFELEESEQNRRDRVAAQRAIIADMLKNLGTDEARVLKLLGDFDAVKWCARECVGGIHESSSSVGCGDTSTVGDGRGEGEGFSGSASPSSRGGDRHE